jgi:hypothetical protein
MAYDLMGNFTNGGYDDEYELERQRLEEEERRRQEEERQRLEAEARQREEEAVQPVAPEQVVEKQQVVTRADGSQTHTTTQERPAPTFADRIQNFVDQERRGLGMEPSSPSAYGPKRVSAAQPVAPGAEGQPPVQPGQLQQRQPGLIERAVNAIIPSAQAAPAPQGQDYLRQGGDALARSNMQDYLRQGGDALARSNMQDYLRQGGDALAQGPVAEAIPVQPPGQTQFRNLANSAGPNVGYINPNAPVEPERTLSPGEEIVEQPVVAGPPATEAGAGRGLVNPPPVTQTAPQAAPAQAPAGGGKLPGETDYDYAVRRQESPNPNIGYHYPADANGNRRSSAYGAYGITAGTYANIQKMDPYFKDREITSLTPEEQTRANQVLTRQNANQLSNYGIEPTPGNLAAAHFLGARGLRDYLQNGYISPQAAAANGGEAKVRQIVEGRINGQYAPASGAANVPVNPNAPATTEGAPAAVVEPAKSPVQAGIDRYQEVQDDPIGLFALRNDESVPKYIRERAAGRLTDFLVNERNQAQGTAKAQEMIASGDTNAIGRTLASRSKSPEGSALRASLLNFIGAHKAAEEEINRWGGYGNRWSTTTYTDKDGNQQTVEVQTGYDGKILGGQTIGDNPRPLNSEELTQAIGGAALGKGTNLSAEVYVDKNTGQRYRSGYDASGKAAMVNIQGGAPFRGDPKNLTIQSIGTAAAKAENAAAVKLRYAGPTSYTEAGAKAAGEFNFQNGTNIGYQTQQPGAPLVDLNTGKPVEVSGNGVISVTQTGTPGAGAPQGAPVQGAPVQGQTPAQIAADRVRQTQQDQERDKSNQVYSDKLAESRSTATSQTSTIDRLQSAIDKNPNFWGIDTNSAAWRAFVDVNSSNENKTEALNTLARNLNIPKEKRAEFDQTMNDYRSLQVNAITGSGLSASQTNTERESQRVIGTVGSISDKPAAAKATLEYAKAKIEYTDAKARAWVEARKKNPKLDRLEFETNFDATTGEKIFKDANERMSKILGVKVNAPEVGTVKDGWVFQGGNPADKNNWKRK